MQFISFLIAGIGLTMIVTQSLLFSEFRVWFAARSERAGEMIHCPMCFGFWAGTGLHLIYPTVPLPDPLAPHFFYLWPIGIRVAILAYVAGLCVSIVSFVSYAVLHKLGAWEL